MPGAWHAGTAYSGMRRAACLAILAAFLGAAVVPPPANAQTGALRIDAQVALASLAALTDGHLRKIADAFQLEANTDAARSAQWSRIRPLLAQIEPMNVPALLWFALPNGTYWSLTRGRAAGNLSTRAYWPRLLARRTVLGDLVISKAAKTATAIVAVPVIDGDRVVGVLGASVYLDKLSTLVRDEMRLPPGAIFYSFNSRALVGINWDKSLIFLEPRALSPDLDRAFGEMLAHNEGRETYTFRGKTRTVIYRKSPVTNWWYAIGFAQQ